MFVNSAFITKGNALKILPSASDDVFIARNGQFSLYIPLKVQPLQLAKILCNCNLQNT